MATTFQVTFDCADPDALGRFWAKALGYIQQPVPEGFEDWPTFLRSVGVVEEDLDSANALVDPDGNGPRLFFQRVPEPKSAKNRVHLDVNASGGLEIEQDERRRRIDHRAAELERLGARRIEHHEKYGEYWVVMNDPEGNEFCLQ